MRPDLEAVRLSVDGVAPIADCAHCRARGACTITDDFSSIMESVTAAELLVLGTPLYWYGPSAQLKAFLDRWSCCLDLDESNFRQVMRAKRVILVVAQGERGFYAIGPYLQMMDWTLRYLDMVLTGRVVVVGHAGGDYGADLTQRGLVRAAGQAVGRGESARCAAALVSHPHRPGEPLGSRPALA